MPGGAPEGNNNAGKAKLWSFAITKALEKKTKKEGVEALQVLAEKLIEACEKGDLPALKEFGDRIEGKPAQSLSVDGDLTLEHVKKKAKFVSPAKTTD